MKGRTNEVAAAFVDALTHQDKLYRDAVNLVDADSAGNPGLLTLLVSQEQEQGVAGPSGALAEQPPDQIEVKLQKLQEQVKELSKTPAGGERWRELVGAVDKRIAAVLSTSRINASPGLACLNANKMAASSARVLEALGPPTLTDLGG